MSDKKIKDYDLDNFANDIKFAPNPDEIENNELDYGDDFDTQTGEEVHNPNDYYIGKPTVKNNKKETARKVKNGAVIACIAVVCLLVVFAFALTHCSMEDFNFSVTMPTTLPTIIIETQSEQEKTNKPYEAVINTDATTAVIEEATEEETLPTESQEATEPETVATEKTTQAVETEPVTEETTELPDPEIEDFGQDQDY